MEVFKERLQRQAAVLTTLGESVGEETVGVLMAKADLDQKLQAQQPSDGSLGQEVRLLKIEHGLETLEIDGTTAQAFKLAALGKCL